VENWDASRGHGHTGLLISSKQQDIQPRSSVPGCPVSLAANGVPRETHPLAVSILALGWQERKKWVFRPTGFSLLYLFFYF
jgi:hypothetical protein